MNHSANKPDKIHFVGIGGSGMSGLAEVLINLGYSVSGSDLEESFITKRLASLGAKVYIGHKKSNVTDKDMLIISSAISKENEEILEANRNNLPILARAELLASLMNLKKGIAIAGTHGKTTTTSILASIMTDASLDPTFINGGIINSFATNAKLGSGDYLIAEADESDQSFLLLQPSLAVITNIEEDHLSNYENNFSLLKDAFVSFAKKIPFDGLIVACGDDLQVKELLPQFSRRVITYGFNEDNYYQIKNFSAKGLTSSFDLCEDGNKVLDVELNILGRHNALNAVASIIVAIEEGVPLNTIQSSLKDFSGINRRMDIKGKIKLDNKTCILIDDYGHHPTEIRSTYQSIQESFPDSHIHMVFQPHRFTRTKDLFDDFVEVLSDIGKVILLDIYSAGEEKIEGISSQALLDVLNKNSSNNLLIKKKDLALTLTKEVEDNSIILMQGAGNISELTDILLSKYKV